jgi:hypothetical protein
MEAAIAAKSGSFSKMPAYLIQGLMVGGAEGISIDAATAPVSSCSRARVSFKGADDDTGRFIGCLLVWVGFYFSIAVGAIGGLTLIGVLREAEWLIGRALSGNPPADIADEL